MVFHRPLLDTLLSRLNEEPLNIIYFHGPRQSGKSTLVIEADRRLGPKSQYMAIDSDVSLSPLTGSAYEEDGSVISEQTSEAQLQILRTQTLRQMWRKMRKSVQKSGEKGVIFFDEIQKIPNFPETIKGLWDHDRRLGIPLHVVLLSSSPLLMQDGLSESLAGRFERLHCPHWSFTEMRDAFGYTLPMYIFFGGYPKFGQLLGPKFTPKITIDLYRRWLSYIKESIIETTLQQDIKQLKRIANPALFRDLFELCLLSSSQIISHNTMYSRLPSQDKKQVYHDYLDSYAQACLLTHIDKYYGQKHWHSKKSDPKFLTLDTGLLSAVKGISYEQAQKDRAYWGQLVESAVGAHIYNTKSPDMKLCYWRAHKNGKQAPEIDFVLSNGSSDSLSAFEVKGSRLRKNPRLSGNLESFKKKFGSLPKIIGAGGDIELEDFFARPLSQWLQH